MGGEEGKVGGHRGRGGRGEGGGRGGGGGGGLRWEGDKLAVGD